MDSIIGCYFLCTLHYTQEISLDIIWSRLINELDHTYYKTITPEMNIMKGVHTYDARNQVPIPTSSKTALTLPILRVHSWHWRLSSRHLRPLINKKFSK